MKVAFYGGQTAGIISLLTLLTQDLTVSLILPEDENVAQIAKSYLIETKDIQVLHDKKFIKKLQSKIDLFICCHGRLLLPKELVDGVKCINLHPCLYNYPGAHPVKRLIANNNPRASVASHWMVEKIDAGETILEEFKMIKDIKTKTEAEVYSQLYPLYSRVLIKTLDKINL